MPQALITLLEEAETLGLKHAQVSLNVIIATGKGVAIWKLGTSVGRRCGCGALRQPNLNQGLVFSVSITLRVSKSSSSMSVNVSINPQQP
jgi:hypothetical protein